MADQQQPFDASQTQWVDVNQQGQQTAPAPAPKKPTPSWVRIAVFVLMAAVGVTLVVVFVLSILPDRPQEDEAQVNEMRAEVEAAIAACREEQDPERCFEHLAETLAQDNGDDEYCSMLEPEDIDTCFALAAQGADDRTICARIQDEAERKSCEDGLFNAFYGADHSFEDCSNYHDGELQQRCEDSWVRDRVREGDCSSPHVAESECAQSELLNQAVEARNPSLCEQITDEDLFEACQELVGDGDLDLDGLSADEEAQRGTSDTNPDSDGDGLGDREEVVEHGTNPALADTDGDGFDDKTELDNGFDPLT